MTGVTLVRDFVRLSLVSFDNASGTMERVHTTSANMSLDLVSELGFPSDIADAYRATHQRFVSDSYSRVREATHAFGTRLIDATEANAPTWMRG